MRAICTNLLKVGVKGPAGPLPDLQVVGQGNTWRVINQFDGRKPVLSLVRGKKVALPVWTSWPALGIRAVRIPALPLGDAVPA